MNFELNNGLREKQSVKTGCFSAFKEGVKPYEPGILCEASHKLKRPTSSWCSGMSGLLPEEKVILADGTDATEEVLKAEQWLIQHSF